MTQLTDILRFALQCALTAGLMMGLHGCAAEQLAPLAQDQAAKTQQPAPGRALIYVYRPSNAGIGVHHALLVNGLQRGFLDARTYYLLDVPPGTVNVTIESVHSFSLKEQVEAGQVKYVSVILAADEKRSGGGGMLVSFSGNPQEVPAAEAITELANCSLIRSIKL